jgi:hypothetical protein
VKLQPAHDTQVAARVLCNSIFWRFYDFFLGIGGFMT